MQAIRKEHGAASNEYTEAMKYVAEGAECDLRKLIDSLPKEMRGQFEALMKMTCCIEMKFMLLYIYNFCIYIYIYIYRYVQLLIRE